MMTLLILLLFIAAVCLTILKYTKTSILAVIAAFACFLMAGSGVLPLLLVRHLQSPYASEAKPHWGKHNAIVVLGAGNTKVPGKDDIIKANVMSYSRIHEAARLYLSCKKSHNVCTLILSGGDPSATGTSQAAVYRHHLLDLGVNNSDIQLEPRSRNTYENSKFTSAVLHQKFYDRVFLVTSGIHQKRSLLYFSRFGISATPAPADYTAPWLSLVPVGYNFAVTDFAIHEYIGIIKFHVYNFLGWN
jgi:uncharacterized SAM-binding protein YcdF (DUF218 family)